jgi:hypothetical protein
MQADPEMKKAKRGAYITWLWFCWRSTWGGGSGLLDFIDPTR